MARSAFPSMSKACMEPRKVTSAVAVPAKVRSAGQEALSAGARVKISSMGPTFETMSFPSSLLLVGSEMEPATSPEKETSPLSGCSLRAGTNRSQEARLTVLVESFRSTVGRARLVTRPLASSVKVKRSRWVSRSVRCLPSYLASNLRAAGTPGPLSTSSFRARLARLASTEPRAVKDERVPLKATSRATGPESLSPRGSRLGR